MGNFENEGDLNEEWDDSLNSELNEFSWERYLQREDGEIEKYKTLYNKLIRSANRLDEVALYMGWQPGAEDNEAEIEEPSAPQPYTLHKHPLFVSSKALHGWLSEQWNKHVALCSDQIGANAALSFQSSISESDYYGLLAVTALDLDDFALAIAYFKRGMVAINKALALLASLDESNIDALRLYVKQARIRLFDIREIWLRVSSDCRATISRGSDEA